MSEEAEKQVAGRPSVPQEPQKRPSGRGWQAAAAIGLLALGCSADDGEPDRTELESDGSSGSGGEPAPPGGGGTGFGSGGFQADGGTNATGGSSAGGSSTGGAPSTSGGSTSAGGGEPASGGADASGSGGSALSPGSGGAMATDDAPRVIVSTDIGGCDADDFQSMVHYLIYADRFRTEGLIASPPCGGRAEDILETLDAYEEDYPLLQARGPFPTPDSLRDVTIQGADDSGAPDEGRATEGSAKIVERAHATADDPLYVLVWGSMTDVAQAVFDDPTIVDKIRVYSIGSWNTGQDRASRDYLYEQHRFDMWWIENDTTFRGMYYDCNFGDDDPGRGFLRDHVDGHGALGDFLYEKKSGLKMGDTPSVLYLLHGDPGDPTGDSWGGSFQVESTEAPTFWTDRDDEACADKAGAMTVGRWRSEYLEDWKTRMDWVKP